ncbi:MAG: restriction endonuclease subunit S [Pseudomonadota bacterium]
MSSELSLAQVAIITSGKRPIRVEKAKATDLTIPVIGGGGPSGYTDSSLYAGNILITGRVGTLGKLFSPSEPCWPSDNALVIFPKNDQTDFRFLRYALQFRIADAAGMNRGAANPLITQKDLGTIPIYHPPLTEQRAIAAILGALDDKIELNRRINETLEAMARAVFRDWFVDFGPTRAKMAGLAPYLSPALWDLFPDRLDDDGKPEGWAKQPLTDFLSIIGGGTPKTSVDEYWNGSIPWFSVADTPSAGSVFVTETEKSITEAGLLGSSARLVRKGSTIITARGTVGNLAMTGQEMTFNQSCYALQGANGVGDCFTYLITKHMVGQLQSMAHGSVFSTITRQTFEAVEMPMVTRTVFEAFEANIAPLFAKILSLVQETAILAQTRDLLLPRLMSGELRVAEADASIAEVL